MTIPSTEKIVLLALADWASDDGVAYPKQCTLASKCSLTDRTIRKTLKSLRESYRLIEWEPRSEETQGRSNTYFLTFVKTADEPIIIEKVETPKAEPKPKPPAKTKPANRATQIPDDFVVDDELKGWACENRIEVDLRAETEQWTDYHKAKGSLQKDWRASWRTWMRNAKKWGRNNANSYNGNANGSSRLEDELNDTSWADGLC
ncbi:helix-turn-helix domain-containing protein [Kistimonas scapharcae]